MRTCSVEGCGGKHRSRGYCAKHYMELKRQGKLEPLPGKPPEPEEDKPREEVKVKPKVKRPCITLAQLAHSSPEAFWCWQKENPIGGARAEKSRLVVRK